MTGPQGTDRADRTLGRVVAIGGVLLMVGSIDVFRENVAVFPLWWNVAGGAVVLLVAVLAVFGQMLPMHVLRLSWCAIPVVTVMLQVIAFAGVDPATVSNSAFPWIWILEPVAVSLLVLILPASSAVLLSLFSGLSTMISAMMFLGAVPRSVVEAMPIHLGNVVFVVLLAGVRMRFARLRTAEEEKRAAELRRAHAEIDRERHAAFSRLVHDEVLSVLSAAMLFRGDPPEILRDEARSALRALETCPDPIEEVPETESMPLMFCEDAVDRIIHRLEPIVPGVIFTHSSRFGLLPMTAVDEVTLAAAEALRNSRTHAGPEALRRVDVRARREALIVTVSDDGSGFDLETMRTGRMGVRESIVKRMSQAGGRATIQTAPGAGVEVTLRWPAS